MIKNHLFIIIPSNSFILIPICTTFFLFRHPSKHSDHTLFIIHNYFISTVFIVCYIFYSLDFNSSMNLYYGFTLPNFFNSVRTSLISGFDKSKKINYYYYSYILIMEAIHLKCYLLFIHENDQLKCCYLGISIISQVCRR